MRLPSLSKPQADPKATYLVCQPFVCDVPNFGPWAPAVGTRYKGSHPAVAYLIRSGGARLFASADTDDAELASLKAEAMFGHLSGPADPNGGIRLGQPSKSLMVSIKPITLGEQGVVPAGSVADAGSALVRRFPDCWTAAPEGYTS